MNQLVEILGFIKFLKSLADKMQGEDRAKLLRAAEYINELYYYKTHFHAHYVSPEEAKKRKDRKPRKVPEWYREWQQEIYMSD